MRYQWDRNKHGIDFADAVSVFSDELAISIFDPRFAEERFIIIGMDAFSRILVVIYTLRDDQIRLISAFLSLFRRSLSSDIRCSLVNY